MGKISDKARELWIEGHNEIRLANVIDFEFEALRQKIRDLRKDIKDGSAFTLDYEQSPQSTLPPEQWERGDMVSYTYKDKKFEGIFHHRDKNTIWGYFQRPDSGGEFQPFLTGVGMPDSTLRFEFRPEK